MSTMMWSPLFLRGEVGPFNNVGGIGYPADFTVNPRLLMNPNRTAMLVDQFRFGMTDIAGLAFKGPHMCALAVELKLGSINLTSGAITVGVLAPRFSYPGQANTRIITMHLHKPLYVPNGVQLSARVIRQSVWGSVTDALNTDLTMKNVTVSVVGRSLPETAPVPSKIWVPWITEAKAGPDAGARFVTKDGTGLHNPHAEPLHIKALIGINSVPHYDANGQVLSYDLLGKATEAPLTVQMTASNDLAVIRDPTPFLMLFTEDRGLLSVNAVLQPGQFIRTEYETVLLTGQNASYNTTNFTSIGMHGYRQIDTPKGT